MYVQVSIAVIGITLFGRANGGARAVCGNDDEINVCKPRHECKDYAVGDCQSLWCCKSETYSEDIPPAGDCICVSDVKYCDMVPFPYKHTGGDCVCCDCTEQCAPLQTYNNSSLTMCPNYERPIGNCDNNQNHYCCPSDESDDLCKCAEDCPQTWKLLGSCGKCCLNEAVNSQVVTKPRTLELLCAIYFTLLYIIPYQIEY